MRVIEAAVQPDIESLLNYYDKLKVYRAATYSGSYSLIDTVSLVPDKSLYTVIDNDGVASDYYRFSYYKSTSPAAESALYDLPVYYFTIAALKDRINDGYSGTDDRNFIDAAAAATQAINRYCGRKFNQIAETRYFQGSPSMGFYLGKGTQVLALDDFVSISSISVVYPAPTGTVTLDPAADVYAVPENAASLDWSFTGLALVPQANPATFDYSLSGYWPQGYHSIAITALWGWPVNPITQTTVPPDIKEAAMEIALRLYKGKDNAYSRSIGQNNLGEEKISDDLMNGDTRSLLAPYVRSKSGMITMPFRVMA